MDFLLPGDLISFRQSLRGFLAANYPLSSLKRDLLLPPAGRSAASIERATLLHQQIAELGVFLSGVSEERGGLGLGLAAFAVVVSECARVLAPAPIFETIAWGVLPALVGELPELERILADGPRITGGWGEDGIVSSVELTDEVWLIRAGLVSVGSVAAAEPVSSADLTRSLATVQPIGGRAVGSLTAPQLARLRAAQRILAAAEIVGAARRVEELTIDFVKTRKQFGTPIGSFQALQHKLADVRVALDGAESLLLFAAWSFDHDPGQLEESSLAAKGFASERLLSAVEACLQAHGGIGFTFEYELHLFLRRVLAQGAAYLTAEGCYRELAALELGKSEPTA